MPQKKFIPACFIIVALILSACSQINKANYNKIKTGMKKNDVYRILGKPTESNTVRISKRSGETAAWKTKDITILIIFVNNKVLKKSYFEISDDTNNSKTEINIE